MLAIARVNNVPNKFDQTFDNTSNMKLENVNEYTYLGIKFHKSGKFNIAIKDRMTKASQAMYIY